jgi:uncharacterized protein YjiK
MRRAGLWILIVGATAALVTYAAGVNRRSPEAGTVPATAPYDLTGSPSWRADLPAELAEVSGIAFTPDGRLFAHGDEDATLWELNAQRGTVRKRFSIATAVGQVAEETAKKGKKGKKDVRAGTVVGDFEDLAIVGERFFLVTSAGRLYEFREGNDGARVPHTVVRTGLEERCEIEGMAHDARGRALLLLCKQNLPKKSAPGRVLVYAWSLEDERLAPEPRLQVDYAAFAGELDSEKFNGSAMAFIPGTQSLVLVAGPQKAFAQVTAEGDLIAAGSLDASFHRQPEGLAFARDGTLLIADEGAGGQPSLTGYAPKTAGTRNGRTTE